MIEAVILDLDGVITDTAEYHYRAWKRLADDEGLSFDRRSNDALRGVSRRRSLEILLGSAIERYDEDQIRELMDRKNGYYREMLRDISPEDFLPGARRLLDAIRDRGLKVAIGSASRNTPTVLERLGIADFFDAVADGHAVVRAKPEPDVFVFAAGALGVPVDCCAVVEDAEAGVDAALNAGMIAVGIGPEDRVGRAHIRFDSTSDINLDRILDLRSRD